MLIPENDTEHCPATQEESSSTCDCEKKFSLEKKSLETQIEHLKSELNKQKELNHKSEREHGNSIALLFEKEFQKDELQRLNENLQNIQNELLDKARKAGQADIAISVVHNIGNFLNSVSVSAGLISIMLKKPVLDRLVRINQIVEEKSQEIDEMLQQSSSFKEVNPFDLYKVCTKALEEEHLQLSDHVAGMNESIAHIRNYLKVQRSYISEKSTLEPLNIIKIIDDTLSIQEEFISSTQIEVRTKFDKHTTIYADKGKLIYILINLFNNSKDALIEGSQTKKFIKISTKKSGDSLAVSISDNGCGIQQENLTNIFRSGFSTKQGRYGFSLHSCANFMKEMGGSIKGKSKGKGLGTTITLIFPAHDDSSNQNSGPGHT